MSHSLFVRALTLTVAFAAPLAACGSPSVITAIPGDGGIPTEGGLGQGVGQPCSDANRCRPGLACNGGTCAPGRSSENGTACVISAECKDGSYCGPERTCAPAGTGADGAACTGDADCKSGFRCNLVGLGARCQAEGQGDVGGACKLSGDCFAGLACANNVCTPLPPGTVTPPVLPTWKGVECNDEPGPVTAYFRAPRGTGDADFFRLPFPNNIRRGANGHPTLNGFPTPGADLLGYDVVDRYVKDVEANSDGFSIYPTVTMRFSAPVDFDSLKTAGALRWVDLGTGDDVGLAWFATTGRSPYVCANSVSFRPPAGGALKKGTTYAVIMTNAVTATGVAVTRSPDLAAVVASAPPADSALTAAHAAYAPLRQWATTKNFDLNTLINAAVFTTAQASRPAEKLATAITAAAVPTATGWIKCAAGAPSPCPDVTGTRACGAADPAFDELHALVSLPIFQKGTAPYEDPKEGGDFTYDGAGAPIVQRTEQVCLSLTVPKGAPMPANGWPLVIYGHGTGGSFRSHVVAGVAKDLANFDDGQGGQRMAVLGIDQVAHGPRRGGSTKTPETLFFNFTNPGAARGNPLQGAADQMALVRFARGLDLTALVSPTGTRIRFDRILYWGHSQGATGGAIAMPYTPDVNGVVFSGAGASLIDALLTKTNPVNIPALLPLLLSDPLVESTHPVLSLLQNAIDPADPLAHARALAAAPFQPSLGKHAFVPFGQKDTYTPSAVQSTYVLAAGLGLAAPPAGVTPEAIGGLTAVPVPASLNLNGNLLTGFTRQYVPAGYDGHFVASQNADGKGDVYRFLSDLAANRTPRVGK